MCLKLVYVCLLNLPVLSGKSCQASSQNTIRFKNKYRSSFKVNGLERLSFKQNPLNGVLILNIEYFPKSKKDTYETRCTPDNDFHLFDTLDNDFHFGFQEQKV